ncbi:MAG: hypothetical protein IJO32_00800 [Bacilli bacterium]|nr:hypothetical protein [Bacilli bacterium]
MLKDIHKRLGIQLIIYIIVLYLIPFISVNFLPDNIRDIVNALFLVVFNLLIFVIMASIDTYKYKLNWFLWILPGLLFIPSMYLFHNNTGLWVYSLLYSVSYGIGMLLGWSYRTYGYQLKPGYKKVYVEEKRKESELRKKEKEELKKQKSNKITTKKTRDKAKKGD